MGRLHTTLLLGILGWASCVPTVFRPARTVSAGEVEHVVTVAYPVEPDVSAPAVPGYTVRFGVDDSVDLGAGLDLVGSLSFDATIQVVRSRRFDLSVGPNVVYNIFVNRPSLGAPVLVDWNIGRMASVVAFAGPVYAFADDGALLLHTGTGVDLRIGEWFSLRPHVGSYWVLSDPRGGYAPYLGLAFGLGGQRDFQ